MKIIATTLLLLASTMTVSTALAQSYSYTTIDAKADRESFIKHWGISDEEYDRYLRFMQVEGRFRYKDLTPLEVLGLSASDDATMQYYAKKAAANEREAVKKQLRFIIMTTEYKKAMADAEKAAAEKTKATKKQTQPQQQLPKTKE